MISMSLLPHRRALTRADLDAMPDDGLRYELLAGALIVTPSPSLMHQAAVAELLRVLLHGCPSDLYVLAAPTDVIYDENTVLQPDLMVVPRSALHAAKDDLRPLLVVEVLSPSTRRIDATVKKDRYESAGCASYWTVDPAAPSVTLWTLDGDRYGPPASYVGEDPCVVTSPFEVTLTPRQLTV